MNGYKIGAAVCCFLYVITFLVLPFVTVVLLPIQGARFLSTFWGWPVLLTGIAMGICARLADGKIAAAVSGVGAFVPLIVFFLAPGSIIQSIVPVDLHGAGGAAGSIVSSYIIQIGAGAILPMLLGIASAILCFLSEQNKKTRKITPGLGAETDDEW